MNVADKQCAVPCGSRALPPPRRCAGRSRCLMFDKPRQRRLVVRELPRRVRRRHPRPRRVALPHQLRGANKLSPAPTSPEKSPLCPSAPQTFLDVFPVCSSARPSGGELTPQVEAHAGGCFRRGALRDFLVRALCANIAGWRSRFRRRRLKTEIPNRSSPRLSPAKTETCGRRRC